MNAPRYCTVVFALLLLAVAAYSPPAWGQNRLSDPSFEVGSGPLPVIQDVLTPFTAGFWAAEAATVVTAGEGITPACGAKMLQMWDAGAVATQAFQAVDVSADSACIDTGNGVFHFSALLNAPGLPQELGGVSIAFFGCQACWGQDLVDPLHAGLYLDALPGTWETSSLSGAIPVHTRWIVVQVNFNNATLLGRAGYADCVELTMDCPTPVVPTSWGRVKAQYR